MKKFTLLIALFVCAIGFSQNTFNAYTPSERVNNQEVVTVKQYVALPGADQFVNPNATTTNTRLNSRLDYNRAPNVVITQSASQDITSGVACAVHPVDFRDNSIYRVFDLAGEFGINDAFTVSAVEIGIEAVGTPSGFPMTVNIYSAPTGAPGTFPGTMTLQGTGVRTITNADALVVVSVDVAGTIPAGESLVIEAVIIDDFTGSNYMTFGLNEDGQTNPTWLLAPVCGANVPTDIGAFGITAGLVLNVVGEEGGGGGEEPTVFITHSDSQTVNPGGSVACGSSSAGYTTENSYFRDFDLAQDFGIFNDFEVAQAEFGMQVVDQNHPLTINVYSLSGDGSLTTSFGDAVLQGTTGYTTTPADVGTVVNVAVSAIIPAGDRLIFQVLLSDGSEIPASFRIGVNDLGQTDASYIMAAACGLVDPLDVAAIGFPDMHLVMNILGDELVPECDITSHEADGLPMDLDGAGTSTADCENEPNLVPVTVEGINMLGENAFIDNVSLSITHTWVSDLTVSLVSPNGTELVLSDANGGSGDNYVGTIFRDGGAPISGGSAPFTGVFAPEGAGGFSVFDGEFAAGDWNLKVCDAWSGDSGAIITFSLDICNFDVVNNDVCEDAFEVACGDVVNGSTDTIMHTNTGGNPASDAWYSFLGAGEPEWVTISLCSDDTDFDTYLRVYDACDGTQIASNDDACGLQSEVRFFSDGLTTYSIMVEGFGSATGNYSMAVTCEAPPANDLCGDAIAISCDSSTMGTTTNASFDNVGDCDTSNTAAGVWYALNDYTGLVTDIHVTTCSDNTDYDTKISVFTGECGELVCLTGNDDDFDCTGFQSSVDFQSDGSSTFYILVHGFSSATGDFELTVDCTPVPPPNDEIGNSIDLAEVGCPYVDVDVPMPAATTEGGNPVNCNIDGANGVWYNITPAGDGTLTATVDTPAGATFVTFYSTDVENPSVGDLTLVDDGDNQCVPGSTTTIPVVAGTSYYIFVVNSGGRTDVSISCDLLGTNDNIIEGFNYYPNPADNAINLTAVDNIESVVIYNILGQKVIDLNVESTTTQINVSNLNTGTYLMKVSVNGEVGTYKVIKR